jgi:hypothetical protein
MEATKGLLCASSSVSTAAFQRQQQQQQQQQRLSVKQQFASILPDGEKLHRSSSTRKKL